MLFTNVKKEALVIHEKAATKYNATLDELQRNCGQLYETRRKSIIRIEEVESLINSIANRPKDFERNLSLIETERTKFRETEDYAIEAYNTVKKSGASVAAGTAGGLAFASMAPTAAMWVATTFGTASTGTAISTLSGAVATKAALAWLGGGAVAAGGGGIAAGNALLALAGPVGWGISAGTTFWSLVALGRKNKKIADEIIEEAKKITIAGAQLKEAAAVVLHLNDETTLIFDNLTGQLSELKEFKDSNYSSLSSDDQMRLGTLVNNTRSLAEMLNKTIE